MTKKHSILLFICFSSLLSISFFPLASANFIQVSSSILEKSSSSDEFYFIQITDTHVMHRLFDKDERYKNRFSDLIEHINSFENKPAFVVVAGDLVSSGKGFIGRLNYKAFLDCVYKDEGRLYADPDFEIPIYTQPGDHDYLFGLNLLNYHRLIDTEHVVWNNNILDLLESRQLSDRYTITYENLTLFFLDTGHIYFSNPAYWLHFRGSGLSYWFDIEWLEKEFNNCDSKHKIVLIHHPAINWGEYDTISRNQENFIKLCEGFNVELVLSGQTHASRVFDKNKNFYPNDALPLNCSSYSTFYVQTDACKEGCFYRNITISGNDVWLNPCEQICIE